MRITASCCGSDRRGHSGEQRRATAGLPFPAGPAGSGSVNSFARGSNFLSQRGEEIALCHSVAPPERWNKHSPCLFCFMSVIQAPRSDGRQFRPALSPPIARADLRLDGRKSEQENLRSAGNLGNQPAPCPFSCCPSSKPPALTDDTTGPRLTPRWRGPFYVQSARYGGETRLIFVKYGVAPNRFV
jgi:hypothetical protein